MHAHLLRRRPHSELQVDTSRQCDLPDNVQIGPLKEWASKDYGW